MHKFMDLLLEFNEISVIFRILLSALIGGLIGTERGRHGRAAGLRTHILVCLGAAITSLTSLYISQNLGFNGDVARLSAQVISGIGFLGAGMIMIKGGTVITGLTTAAGMWATAAIGIAIGYGFYIGAIVSAAICIFSVTVLSRLEKKRKSGVYVYIEIPDIKYTDETVAIIRNLDDQQGYLEILPPKSGYSSNVGIMCIITNKKAFDILKHKVLEFCCDALVIYDINS